MRNFRSAFIPVLFLLVLLAAAVWVLSENAATNKREALFSELINTKIGLLSSFASFLERENKAVLQKLDKFAGRSSVEVERLAKFENGVITEESRKKIDSTLKEILPPYLETVIFGNGKKPYAFVSERFAPVVPFLMKKSAVQKRGMLEVKFPTSGFLAYSCATSKTLNTCVFLSTSLITRLVGDEFRKPARLKAEALLGKLSASSTLGGGMTYILGEKIYTDRGEFPDGLEEAIYITPGEMRTFSNSFLTSVFYVKADVPGMKNFHYLSYVVLLKPQMRFLLLLVIAFLLAPIFTLFLVSIAGSKKNTAIDADILNILLDALKRPYAVFTRNGEFVTGSNEYRDKDDDLAVASIQKMLKFLESIREHPAGSAEDFQLALPESRRTLRGTAFISSNQVVFLPIAPPFSENEYVDSVIFTCWRGIIRKAHLPIAVLDGNGSFRAYNKRFLNAFGYEEDVAESTLEGLTIYDLLAFVGSDKYTEIIEAFKEHKPLYALPVTLFNKAGGQNFLFFLTHERKEDISVSLLTIIDQTQFLGELSNLEKINDELTKNLNAKSRMIGFISHEIRNTIQIFISKMLDDFAPAKTEKREELSKRVDLLGAIVNGILEFTKLESNSLTPLPVEFSIDEFVDEMVRMFSASAVKKGIQFDVELIRPTPKTVFADESRILLILTNIINNAFKFVGTGAVKLLIAYSKPDIIFEISDTGIGLHPNQQEKLFKEFYRTADSPAAIREGAGLGLAITRKLVEILNGKIELTSSPGKGTVFTITIPVTIVEDNSTETRPDFAAISKKLDELSIEKPRVFVLEDDLPSLELYKASLTRASVDFGCSGIASEEILDTIQDGGYNVFLTDDQMDGITGSQLARLARDRFGDGLIIVLITGMPKDSIKDASLFDSIVYKPVPSLFWQLFKERLVDSGDNDTCPIDSYYRNFLDDPDLFLLLVDYVDIVIDTCTRIMETVRSSSIAELKREVHSVKGTSANYGLRKVSKLSEELEAMIEREEGADTYTNQLERIRSEAVAVSEWLKGRNPSLSKDA